MKEVAGVTMPSDLGTADSKIVFSMDVDWVPDFVLAWAIHQFKAQGFPVTVFATHETEVLREPSDGVEVGIHPDFFSHADHKKHLQELKVLYPEAKGVRAHGLFEYSNLMNMYRSYGLQWDSSQLLYLCSHIMPYRHPSGLIRLPVFFEDDDYFHDNPDWIIDNLNLDKPGVKCFDFHPIHLFLNTYSSSQYLYVKEKNFSRESIERARYQGDDKGVYSFLLRLTQHIRCHSLKVLKMEEVCSWA